jgi:hypothetical protein
MRYCFGFAAMIPAIGGVGMVDAASAEGGADGGSAIPELAQTKMGQTTPITVGYVETVLVDPGNRRATAKIDTGAKTSSIDTLNILPFMKRGKEWVRFTVSGDDSQRWRFELAVVRIVRIKRAGAPTTRRYVVEMGICLGTIYKMAEVNLVNRRRMKYRMLIGRDFMAGDFLVDPKAAFLTRPACQDR